jgi:hexosaminidase
MKYFLSKRQAERSRYCGGLVALVCAAMTAATVNVTRAAGNAELISVDFVVGGSGGDGSGRTAPCAGDTVLTGTTMNNAVGNLYSGQVGAWNYLSIGTYNQTSASSGFLTNGSGAVTTAKLVLGQATGLNSTLAGGWRCSPNEGVSGSTQQLRAETAYLYNGVVTGDHFAWKFTGLIPNSTYKLTFFGGGNATSISNVAAGVAGTRDTEGDWNWATLTADSNGSILGTFTATSSTPGLYGAQLEHLPRTVPPQTAPSTPQPADGATNVPTFTSLGWATSAGAETYELYLWPSSAAQPAEPNATLTTGQFTPPDFLSALTSYRWRVVARNPVGVVNGPVWTFTTDDGRPLAPGTPSPVNGATNVLVETMLDWGDSLKADNYQVFIWPASGSKPATPTATVTASSYLLQQPLIGNTPYRWQVAAINANGTTNGAEWSFTTGDRYPGYLIPWPKTVTMGSGDFSVTSSTRIVAEHASLLPLAQVMAKDFFMATGLTLTTLQGTAQAGDIALRINVILTGEAYTLEVNGSNIVLSGGNYQAAAWASVTLLQALNTTGTPVKVPQMLIADQPAAPLRSVMWDIGRFFHPLETLYEFVDLHRMYKVTHMHLFMSADGLFTFGTEIPALAALKKTSNGNSSAGFYLPPAGSRLYYTKAELSALVEYAKNRGVVIVPEIDTPSWAALMTQTLPAVFSSVGGTTVTHDININYSTAVTAVENLIGELAAVFYTSPYIHIGADEVPTSDFETYPYYATSKVTNNYASGGEGLVWYLRRLDAKLESLGKSSWAWSAPGAVGKGYDMRTNMVYTAWGYDDGQNASQGGYSVIRAAGGHVAGYGQQSNAAPYNRCLLYRPAQGIYNRLTPLLRFIGAPDNIYTELTPTFLPLTGRENKILGAHIMAWETPWEVEVPAFRLSMPALGEPTWNQETSPRRNWDNFLMRQKQTDALYQRVMRPVNLSVTTQVDPKDTCFTASGMVTMTSPVAGTIRYTVGTNYNNSWYNFPTSTSTAYTGPFAITQSSVISARLFDAAGNPLGNPVTRGFYLITPKTHYQYFFTGASPAVGFEQGTPIVSSVMGRMDGNAPHEDIRFGDNQHRTIYSGTLQIATAGAYTFSANYGGAITIDRVPLADGTPVTLTTGEHLVKIVTPASGLGTPYTYSGPGASAGSDINTLLKPLNTSSQVFPATSGFGTRSLNLGASESKEITIINHSVSADLAITSVQLAGTHPGEFLISNDSGETVLAPGAERIVAVRFNPTTVGSKTATLRVVAANLPGGAAEVTLTGTAVAGTLPAAPATPSPANATSGVSVNPTLDWADAVGATSYGVYLWLASDSKPATATATVTASQWTPPSILTNGATYNWQVVAINTQGSTDGPQWAFQTGTASVQFSNLTDGQVFRYSMVLVEGTFDGGSTLTMTAAPATAGVSFTKYGSRFRCLVDLKPGSNTLTVTDSQGPVALNLVFTPPTATNHRFKIWYVVPSDEANSPVDPDYATHFSLQAKLMQSWMAEDQLRAGNGRLTFYPELDVTGNVSVGKLVVSQTRAQATALGTGMYSQVWNQLPTAYKDGLHKNLVFSSVAFNALGSGDLCYVGAYTNFHPSNATQMMSKLLSPQLGNDNALTYATYTGVTLHEMIHCLHSTWHDTSDYNIMGGGGYDISQYFTLTYSASNPVLHNESSAGTLGKQRDLAAWNRYLMSADSRVYQNTTVGLSAGPEYLTATSAYPLAVFHYYVPDAAANQHTLLAASNVTTYRKHAGQARLELGSHPFNVMAVDTEGNMSYTTFSGTVPVVPVADSYSVTGSTLVVAAPGVLGNDINPSASALTAAVSTNVQHGTLVLNANGGFSYTPTAGYSGTDTFTYIASDGVSSDQQALVTLTVTSSQLPPPTNPVPATGATAVPVNSALDWADSVGATGYQVYLWPSAQAKPATPTAIVTVSNYVPSANLIAATQYSWQVVATRQTDSSAGAIWSFATASGAPLSVSLQADLNGNRGTANTGPVQSGWTGISGTNTAAPWTNTYTINGITIALSAGSGNSGWRNDRTQLTVSDVGSLAPMYNSSAFANGGFDVKMTGLTAGTTYNFILYATDTGNNVADVHWYYSLAGDKSNPVDAGWIYQPGSTAFTPTANTGITLGTKGIAMLSTTFTATGPAVDFFSLTGTVAVLSGFELYEVPASALAANAGADKTVSPGTPSVAIGANPLASGGTGPYTYSWSPATGLSSATVSNPTASPTSTTIYTVTVTDSLSATASDSVTVNYPLAANAGADKLCTPSSPSATIGATPTANGGTGPYTYLWSPSTGLSSTTVANPVASPSTTTTYTVQVTDSLSATSSDSVVVTYSVPNANLISVDFKQGSGTTCVGNTTLTGTTMKNAVGNVFTGQVGNWNALNMGTYNSNSAISGFLNNGAGTATTVKLALGRATGLNNTAAGAWRCSPNEGAPGGPDALRSESAYLYYPALTVDHYAWTLTGLTPNAHYRLTLFGNGTNTFTNIANSAAGVPDAEGDWNWTDITADGSGVILGTLLTTGNNQTFGLYGLQIETLGTTPSGYATWADTYAGGGTADEDYNNDGVQNGIAYFMGMNGLATNPGVVGGTVTWPRDPAATITSFRVQISDNLATWTDIVPPNASIDTSDPNQVTYTLPTDTARKFCRLVVVP